MEIWKKALIWCGVIIGGGAIFVIIVYAILRNFSIPTAPAGDYILKSVEVKTDAGYETIEEYFDKSYFITIDDEGLLISHSSDKGIVENDVGYVVAVIGEELAIYFNDDEANLAYQGYYKDGTIKISVWSSTDLFRYTYVLEETK